MSNARTKAFMAPVAGTAVATTSGTTVDFTGIPSWAKRITVIFNGVSVSGTANFLIQSGTSSGIENTGYSSAADYGGVAVTSTAGYIVKSNAAVDAHNGILTLCLVGSNIWVASGIVRPAGAGGGGPTAGTKTLAGTLDRIRLTTTNGTDTFDAGSVNILYE